MFNYGALNLRKINPVLSDPESIKVQVMNENDTKNKLSNAGSSLKLKRLKAPEDETSLFMSSFDPSVRRTETLKKKHEVKEDGKKNKKGIPEPVRLDEPKSKKDEALYDSCGVSLSSGLDLCDCLQRECPGCHFDCPSCGSNKCGHICRNNRTWEYDSVVLDGQQSEANFGG